MIGRSWKDGTNQTSRAHWNQHILFMIRGIYIYYFVEKCFGFRDDALGCAIFIILEKYCLKYRIATPIVEKAENKNKISNEAKNFVLQSYKLMNSVLVCHPELESDFKIVLDATQNWWENNIKEAFNP